MRKNRKAALMAAVMAAGIGAIGKSSRALADDFNWTGGDATNPTLWSTTAGANWTNATTNTPSQFWVNNSDRTAPNNAFFFLVPPTTIQVNDNIDAGIIGFTGDGWVLDPASTGVISSGAASALTLQSNGDNTVGVAIVDGSTYGAGGGVTAVNITGGGTVRLTATNTYTGGSTITDGEMRITDLANIGSGNITVNGTNAFLGIDGTTITNIDARLANPDTFNGGFNIVDPTNTVTVNVALTNGAGVLQKAGAGTLVLNAANSLGGVRVNGGVLKIDGGNDRIGTGTLQVNLGGAFDLNGFNQQVSSLTGNAGGVITNSAATTTSILTVSPTASIQYDGSINDGAGKVALVKAGSATLTLTGNSTYSGGTSINGGTLAISSDSNLGAPSGPVSFDNAGVLLGTSTVTLGATRAITLNGGGGKLDSTQNDVPLTLNGTISGPGALNRTVKGAGQGAGPVVLGGNNNFTGDVTIDGVLTVTGDDTFTQHGGLIVTSDNALGSTAAGTTINSTGWLGIQGGINYTANETVTLNTAGQVTGTIRNISGDNTFAGSIVANANALNIGVDSGSLKLTGTITGSGGLIKVGPGTLTFESSPGFSGSTTVQLQGDGRGVSTPGGTLVLKNAAVLPGALTMRATGALVVDSSANGTGAVARTTSLAMGNNSKLTILGSAANTTTDSFGNLALNSGGGEPTIEIKPGSGQTAIAQFGTYTRDPIQNGSSAGAGLVFKGPNFGAAAGTDVAQAIFSTAPSSNGGIIRSMTIIDPLNNGGRMRFATNGSNGVRQLQDSEYNQGSGTGGGVINNGNVRLTSDTTTTLTADATVNSLSLEGDNVTLTGAFNIRPGTSNGLNAMLSTGTGNVISTNTLDFGSTSATAVNEGMIWVEGDLTISSVIRNTTGATTVAPHMAITKNGSGELILAGDNTFLTTETTANRSLRISNGFVAFSSTGVDATGTADSSAKNLGVGDGGTPGGRVTLMSGGGLHLRNPTAAALGTVFVPQVIQLGQANQSTIDGTSTFIQVDGGDTLKTAGILQRASNTASGFTKTGPGELALIGGTTFDRTGTGKSYLAEGTLTIASTGGAIGGLQTGGWLVASPGTTLNLDSSGLTNATQTRLGNVVLSGVDLNVTGNSTAATNNQIATYKLAAGASRVDITVNGGQTATINATNTAGPFTRDPGGTLVVTGADLGTSSSGVARFTLAGSATPPGMVGGIVPYALVDTTVDGPGTSFAAFTGSSNGFTALTTSTASISAAGNVLLSASDNSAGTVNSLHLDGSGISAGSGVLSVTSGAILNRGGANSIDATTLDLGNAEGIVHALTKLTINSSISGSNGLTKAGAGELNLTAANTYSGATNINAGVLKASNAAAISGGNVSLNGGVLGLATGDFTRGLGTGDGQVRWRGAGGFAAYGADRDVNLGGSAASVAWSAGNFLPLGSALILGAGDATNTVDFQNPIELSQTGYAGLVSRTFQIDDGSAAVDAKLSGTLSGKANLVKTGAGALALTASNTYTGSTTVNGGTLIAANNKALGASPAIVVNGGGTLRLGANLQPLTITSLSLNDTGRLDVNNDLLTTTGTLAGTKALITAGNLVTSATAGYVGYADAGGGSVKIRGTTGGDADVNGVTDTSDFTTMAQNFASTSTLYWQDGDFNNDGVVNAIDFNILATGFGTTLTPAAPAPVLGSVVPEPASLSLLALGAAGLLRRRRR